ncbi:acyl-CoA carboxylase subunit beta [Jutongia huaianensis]|uniref:Carboxyl transferase n=1 Tax=Jutongia huaianensis TaxID=2763668 RepID=A0ABR7MZI4_9FIRM|nr:carboxyl transferase domain-containing protein [Jutongia huaianensis]MBC8561799.1 carboxyl transferase [Jutongia huaianensis]
MSNSNTMSAKDRIASLVDENSFVELGAGITKRSTDFNMQEKSVPADGVITGYGLIQNNPVYVYSQDASALNGTIGEMHAKKIAHIYELAMKTGVPVIGLIDCAGMRLQESTDALAGFGQIYKMKAKASGVIPQISAIFGNCGGGVAVMAAMSDFTFMEQNNGKLFVNSPNTLEGNYTDKLDTASADFQKTASVVDVICDGEAEVFENVRNLVSILPENNNEIGGMEECLDDLNRLVPDFAAEVKDPAAALEDLGDNNFFLELKKDFAKEMVTGFISLDGMTVGCVANRTAVYGEDGSEQESFEARLTSDGCDKAASFIKTCDAFNIPILTLTNVEGFATTVEEEKTIASKAAALTAAFAEADVPKVNLITGNAYGSAYITMNSKHIGADMVFALPDAKIGMMDAQVAAKIMYADDKDADLAAKAAEFASQSGTEAAAARGYIDSIISPEAARKQLIFAFELLFTKSEYPIGKKHGTI